MNEKTILIIGANGQLGKALQAQYPNAQAVDMDTLDISSQASVDAYDWTGIKIILNAAAYTNVDGAETAEGRISAWQANALAPANLARIAAQKDITIVHISTDYVFDGTKSPHTESEPFSPLSVYGASKAAGDIVIGTAPKHYIILTSWVIGEGKNFVRTMLELGQKDVNPSVVNDQIGRLTFTSELVRAINHLLSTSAPYGTYNVSNDGEPVSWADITREIFKGAGLANTVTGVTTEQYYAGKEGIAPRPLQSTLDLSKIKATGFVPRDWHEDLAEYVNKELRSSHLNAAQGAGEE
jgi:dTDP-4-dehydrorhamnose 3,5-epimerase